METIYDKIHTLSLDTDDKTHILDNLKQIEYKIIDVTFACVVEEVLS